MALAELDIEGLTESLVSELVEEHIAEYDQLYVRGPRGGYDTADPTPLTADRSRWSNVHQSIRPLRPPAGGALPVRSDRRGGLPAAAGDGSAPSCTVGRATGGRSSGDLALQARQEDVQLSAPRVLLV
eukprot:5606210-Prymnesium_polylepis.2